MTTSKILDLVKDSDAEFLDQGALRWLDTDQVAAQSAERRSQVGGGGRGEKIRTYNYKENRLTDHRIPITLHSLDRVLQGELDEVIDALAADERARQLGGE